MLYALIHIIQLVKKIVFLLKLKKLDIDKLVKVPNGLNDLNTEIDDVDIENLNLHVHFRQLTDVVSREIVKNTKGIKREKKTWKKNWGG